MKRETPSNSAFRILTFFVDIGGVDAAHKDSKLQGSDHEDGDIQLQEMIDEATTNKKKSPAKKKSPTKKRVTFQDKTENIEEKKSENDEPADEEVPEQQEQELPAQKDPGPKAYVKKRDEKATTKNRGRPAAVKNDILTKEHLQGEQKSETEILGRKLIRTIKTRYAMVCTFVAPEEIIYQPAGDKL